MATLNIDFHVVGIIFIINIFLIKNKKGILHNQENASGRRSQLFHSE